MRSVSQLRRIADLHAEKAQAHRGLCRLSIAQAHKTVAPAMGSHAGLITAGIGGLLGGKLLVPGGQANTEATGEANDDTSSLQASSGSALRSVALSVLSRYAFQLLEPLLPQTAEDDVKTGENPPHE